MSSIDYVMVMHDGGLATRFMSEDYCKNLLEQLAAAQSQEVCTVAHSAESLVFCQACEIERLRGQLAEARELLLEARISVSAERAYSDYEPRVKYLTDLLAKIDAASSEPPQSAQAHAPTTSRPR